MGRDQITGDLGIMMRNLDFNLCVLKTNQAASQKTLEGLIMGGRDYLISNLKKNHSGGMQRRNGTELQWKVTQEAIAVIQVRDNGDLSENCSSRGRRKGRYLTYILKVK